MKTCLFSNRIYKYTMSKSDTDAITKTLFSFNKGVRTAYSLLVRESHGELFPKSIHLMIKDTFQCNDYYANSIVQEATGIYKSNVALQKTQISNLSDKVKRIDAKISKTEKTLFKKELLLQNIIDYSKSGRTIFTTAGIPKLKIFMHDGKPTVIYRDKELSLYLYEVKHLKPEIVRLKNKISMLQCGKSRVLEKKSRLELSPRYACFGGKNFFKKQYTIYQDDHAAWKEIFDFKRNHSFQISGRKDALQGNFVFKYKNHTLTFKTLEGVSVSINQIFFPYGQQLALEALSKTGADRHSIAWELDDRGEYYIVKAIIELPNSEHLNDSVADGIIGLDINVDHFALTNISATGNLLDHKIIPFDLSRKSSHQSDHIIGNAVKEIFDYCKLYHKPLAMEHLSFQKKKTSMKYDNPKKNKILSEFAYQKMTTAIYSRAYKEDIAIFKVNPAYTSQIGKIKYMKPKGISIHTAASFVIGRRALGYKEKLPRKLIPFLNEKLKKRHHWSHWAHVSTKLSSVKPHKFYKVIPYSNYKTLSKLKTDLIDATK